MPKTAQTVSPLPVPEPLSVRAARAADVAAAHAGVVDTESRFPQEALEALKAEKLLGIMVPAALGGEAAGIADVVDVCYTLGRACSSTGMIYAMHQVKAACIAYHGMASPWHRDFMGRMLSDQLLLASSTTEGKGGGNVRSSEAPVEQTDGRIVLVRDASVISYGAEADAVVTTARRAAKSDASDQVLVVFEKKNYALEKTGGWDTLGMRGTCSAGFSLKAVGSPDQILPVPYGVIHSQTMVPASHLMWSGNWAGIAAGAVERAKKFMRKAQRAGALPPGVPHFTQALAKLRSLRALIAATLDRYEAIAHDPRALSAIDFQTAINLLKVDASELAVETVMNAMRATGLSGYRNDTDVSIGRSLRDILSSPIMINNDRILSSLTNSTILSDIPSSIRD
ncbi:MAG TPA: acyl-CoA dehydrogenase family protein [Rhizomicrobium sp.]|jgi:acyl-CoA dehydrogenase|nr:acyl-CoA dehydrogenase family protein [Rhizomicrobium sp.]